MGPFTKFHVLNPTLPTAMFSSNATNDSVQISFDEAGNYNLGMFLLYDGVQDELEVFGKTGGGPIGPHLTIDRDNGQATFFGDVDMPSDAIDAVEISDEPGVAQEQNTTTHSLTSTTMVDIETIQITIPAAGYIVLEGRTVAWLGGVTGSNQVYMQIDETSGGSISSPHWTKAGLSSYGSTSNSFFLHVLLSDLFEKFCRNLHFSFRRGGSSRKCNGKHRKSVSNSTKSGILSNFLWKCDYNST